MYTIQPKKLMIINILDILKKYTDEDHRLSQKDIVDILKKEYSMPADRKAVKSNLMNLVDFGYPINYSESLRKDKNGEDKTVLTDWYLSPDFSDAELRLLIDGLLFSRHIPYSQRKELTTNWRDCRLYTSTARYVISVQCPMTAARTSSYSTLSMFSTRL